MADVLSAETDYSSAEKVLVEATEAASATQGTAAVVDYPEGSRMFAHVHASHYLSSSFASVSMPCLNVDSVTGAIQSPSSALAATMSDYIRPLEQARVSLAAKKDRYGGS